MVMTGVCTIDETIYRCMLCETRFEAGVADDGEGGIPRCPQCGLTEAEPVSASEGLVIRRTTRFR